MWDGGVNRALQAHRGSYKTTAMAVGVIRKMLFFPNDRGAIVRKTFTDAAEIVAMIGEMMDLPEIKALFQFAHGFKPKARVRREGKLLYNFKQTKTPEVNVTAHGLDGSLTGHHYDWIWTDDIITLKDRVSKAERERSKEIIREIVTNIIDPGKPVMHSGTPWHKDDAWNVILFDSEGNQILECPKYPVSKCGILSPEEREKKKKTTTPLLYALNYDLTIENETDLLFQNPVYGTWDYHLGGVKAHLDSAFDGDHTCALTMMAKRKDKKYQAKGWIYTGNVKDWIPEIVRLCKLHRVQVLYNETNADKGFVADKIKEYGVHVETYPETQNKHIKISSYGYEAWFDTIWDDETDPEHMNQILDYRFGQEPDDGPDSYSSLCKHGFKASNESYNNLCQY